MTYYWEKPSLGERRFEQPELTREERREIQKQFMPRHVVKHHGRVIRKTIHDDDQGKIKRHQLRRHQYCRSEFAFEILKTIER